jgi:hypothetical protein
MASALETEKVSATAWVMHGAWGTVRVPAIQTRSVSAMRRHGHRAIGLKDSERFRLHRHRRSLRTTSLPPRQISRRSAMNLDPSSPRAHGAQSQIRPYASLDKSLHANLSGWPYELTMRGVTRHGDANHMRRARVIDITQETKESARLVARRAMCDGRQSSLGELARLVAKPLARPCRERSCVTPLRRPRRRHRSCPGTAAARSAAATEPL